MSKSSKFIEKLRNADSEKLIESAYHEELLKYFPINTGIITACGTDGVLETRVDFEGKLHILKLIIETKFQETFSSEVSRSKVLAQVIYYLKKFDESGDNPPNVVLVGDKDECFVVHSNYLTPYLDMDYNWKIAPSSAGVKNIDLVEKLINNKELQEECFVFTIDDNFIFDDVYNRIYNLTVGVKTQVRITERSISKVFDYFSMRVLKKNADGSSKYSPREQVELFMWLVNNTDDCYSHPKKKNTAIFGDKKNIAVNTDCFESFTRYYKFDYNAKEKKDFTAIADRLIEDSDRRRKGDFYTPSIWVDEAHKMLAENLGHNWKDEYMVWDCAWGTGNLTRDYKFWDLYCSTLEEHDLVIGKRYNESACKFQYDFLNDDVEMFDALLTKVKEGYKLKESDFKGSKLYKSAPNLIRGLLSGKKLLFLINPPYKNNSCVRSLSGSNSQASTQTTNTRKLMLKNNVTPTDDLYLQFIYRVCLTNKLFGNLISLGIFSPASLLISEDKIKFREFLLGNLSFTDGYVIQASNFSDVSSCWSIGFTLFKKYSSDISTNNFTYRIKELNDGLMVDSMCNKVMYNLDNREGASKWVRQKEEIDSVELLTMSSALQLKPYFKKSDKRALFTLTFNGNKVESNQQRVTLLSNSGGVRGWCLLPCLPENFERVVSYFSARRLIKSDWINWQDEYLAPNTEHKLYQQWENDCIVYSLFNSKSNQSSLRGINYNSKSWDILNHFFFMSKQDMLDLALGENPNDEVYEDIQNFADDERFVYKKLQEVTLSEDAQRVLDKARELVKLSFKYRKYFDSEHPEYNINTWDAGWYQIKGLCKEYLPEELKEFNQLYKQFEDRMRPLVYELGFLYK